MLFIVIFLANLLVRGPDLYYFLNQPKDRWFTGQASWFDPWDINAYLTAINAGERNGFLLTNLYDVKTTQTALIYPLYTWLGVINRWFNLSPPLIFHVAGTITASLLIWLIIKWLINNKEPANLIWLIVFGGGLGWYFYPKILGLDIAYANATLFGALRSPHEAISLMAYLILLGYRKKRWLLLIFFGAILLLTHPYMMLPILFILILKQQWRDFGVCLILSIVYGLTAGRAWYFSETFGGLFNQTHVPVNVVDFLIGLGLLAPLMVVSLSKRDWITGWFLIQLIFIFLPTPYNRLWMRGLWLPACILAFRGMKIITNNKANIFWITLIGAVSSGFIFYHRVTSLSKSPFVFRTKQEHELILSLNQLGKPDEVVIADFPLMNLIPVFTNKRTFGHMVQTPDHQLKLQMIKSFYAQTKNPLTIKQFISDNQISYVWINNGNQAVIYKIAEMVW